MQASMGPAEALAFLQRIALPTGQEVAADTWKASRRFVAAMAGRAAPWGDCPVRMGAGPAQRRGRAAPLALPARLAAGEVTAATASTALRDPAVRHWLVPHSAPARWQRTVCRVDSGPVAAAAVVAGAFSSSLAAAVVVAGGPAAREATAAMPVAPAVPRLAFTYSGLLS